MLKGWRKVVPIRIAPLDIPIIAALIVVTVKLFGDVVWHMIYQVGGSDYIQYVNFARDMVENNRFAYIHFMYQAILIGLRAVFGLSYEAAGVVAADIVYVLTALLLYVLLRWSLNGFRSSSRTGGWWKGLASMVAAVGAIALLLVTPITLLTMAENKLYLGYVGINVLHNPSMVMLKPFALLLFLFALGVLERRARLSVGTVALGFGLVVLCLFAKPSFVLTFLPVLLLTVPYSLYRREFGTVKLLIGALIAPMVILLALQYLLQYNFIDVGTSIVFAPLGTVSIYEPDAGRLLVKFIMSILFPLVVYGLYARKAIRDTSMNVGWLTFLSGAGQMYLFGESGERFGYGNLWWSAQIGLFVLFVITAVFWMRQIKSLHGWLDGARWLACLIVLGVHLYCGIVYYTTQLQTGTMFDYW